MWIVAAVLGTLSVATGLLTPVDALAVLVRTAPVLVFLVAVTVLAELAEAAQVFDVAAVLLTPVALALAARLCLPPLPFAMASVWLANTASLALPVSNLTNLLALRSL